MIGSIIRKELLVNLLSLRFGIGLVVATAMMGIVGGVLTGDYADRSQKYLSDVQEHRQALAATKVFSNVEAVVDIPPSPLSVFAQGIKDAPSSIRVSPYHVPTLVDESAGSLAINLSGSSRRPVNPLLRIFAPVDLGFVIGTIFSLFAVLLVFDGFSGEREQGTLKLILSSSVSRVRLLLGKFLGALISLAIPLALGFVEILLIWGLSPRVSLQPSDGLGLFWAFAVSLVFLAVILALGMLISLLAKESSSSFMFLLVAWIVVAVVVPAGGEYLVDGMRPSALRESLSRERAQAKRELEQAVAGFDYRQKSDWMNARTSLEGGEAILGMTPEEVRNRLAFNAKVFPLKFRYAERRARVAESYGLALTKWSRFRGALERLSPRTLYENVLEAVAGTNLAAFEDVVRRGRFYRESLMAYLEPKLQSAEWFTRSLDYPDVQPTEPNRESWQRLIESQGERAVEKILSWDRVAPLDLGAMPLPRIALPGLGERLRRVWIDGLLLLGGLALLLFLSAWRMVRYPLG